MNVNRVRRSINEAPLQSSVPARSQRSLRVSATHRGRKTSPKMRTISRIQNCRTQRITSEGEAAGRRRLDVRAGPQYTYQWPGGRGGRGAAASAWRRGPGAHLSC
ncbi:hypothetical protein MRX96_056976 [Rhipicephalus microplus]